MMLTTKTNAITDAVQILTRDPEWIAADRKATEIRGQLDQVERQISHVGTLAPSEVDTRSRAEAMLEGRATVSADVLRAEQLGQYGFLCDRRRVLTEALRLAEARREDLRRRLSAKVHEQIMPAYRRLVGRLADALATVAEVNDDLEIITNTMEREGVSLTGLRPAQFASAGRATDEYANANVWRRDAVEHGLIDDKETAR